MRLGLIGTAIQASRMPVLQRLAAARTGQTIDYVLHDLKSDDPEAFDRTFDACRDAGYRGVNVTHPFKEVAARRVRIDDPRVAAMGAVNTVLFDGEGTGRDGARGLNTDHSGFLWAWRRRFGDAAPGRAALIGTGGVGRAIAFALAVLGADEIRLFDVAPDRARALADALGGVAAGTGITVAADCEDAVAGADGILNATPIGMHHHPGCPVPKGSIGGQRWAFDAIYTPVQTEFLTHAATRGIETLSGFDLFLGQGVDGFEIFTGVRLSDADVAAIEKEIRADLMGVPPSHATGTVQDPQ